MNPVEIDVSYDTELSVESPFPEWIETERLRLERFSTDTVDLRELRDLFQFDGEVSEEQKYLEFGPYPQSIGGVRDLVEDWNTEKWESGELGYYLMFEKASNELIGIGGFEGIDWEKHRAQIGYFLKREYWGQRYSSERATALFEVGFRHLGFDVIYIRVAEQNLKSVKAVVKYLEAHGGEYEGVRYNDWKLNGVVHDGHTFSITSEQYEDDDDDAQFTCRCPLPIDSS